MERGTKVAKQPTHWVRKLNGSEANNTEETADKETVEDLNPKAPVRVGHETVSRSAQTHAQTGKSASPEDSVTAATTAKKAPVFAPWGKYQLRSATHIDLSDQITLAGLLCGCDSDLFQSIFQRNRTSANLHRCRKRRIRSNLFWKYTAWCIYLV